MSVWKRCTYEEDSLEEEQESDKHKSAAEGGKEGGANHSLKASGFTLSNIFLHQCGHGDTHTPYKMTYLHSSSKARPLWFESQNQSFIKTEQSPDGYNSGTIAGVAESALLDKKNPRISAIFCSPKWTLRYVLISNFLVLSR